MITGKCVVCGINLGANKRPKIMPCGVGLFRENNTKPEDRQVCPYETREEQTKLMEVADHEKIAGLLGTMHTNE